jgi:hypothetical protein
VQDKTISGSAEKMILLIKWLVILGALGYLAIGLYLYIYGGRDDLARRWREAGYWLNGYDPIQVALTGTPFLSNYGHLNPIDGYPPWSYVYALLVAPPILSLQTVKLWFFTLNVTAIATLGFIIKDVYRGLRKSWLVLYAAALCSLAMPVALSHQQYGILVTTLIWTSLYFESQGQPFWAGLALAFAFIKPQMAGLFFLIPLSLNSYKTCLWCITFLLLATGIAAWRCHTWPWVMLSEMFHTGLSNRFYMGIGDPLKNLIGGKPLLLISIALFVPLVFVLLRRWKMAPIYHLAAIPAVFSTFWMSHRVHDLMIISLLVVPLLALALEKRSSWLVIISGVVGLAYWFPHLSRFYAQAHFWPVPLLFRGVWLFGLFCLLEQTIRPTYKKKAPGFNNDALERVYPYNGK